MNPRRFLISLAVLLATGVPSARATDTTAPTVPGTPNPSRVSGTLVDLSWSASSDDTGVSGYTIYRDGEPIGHSTSTTYQDTTGTEATAYSYTVTAYDAAGNASAQSSAAAATTGNVYYVSPDGSDANAGTKTAPWQHVAFATNGGGYLSPIATINPHKIAAGDVLYLQAGTYYESRINICNSGTATRPITMKPAPGATAIIDGSFAEKVFRLGESFTNNYIIFDGLEIRHGRKAGIQIGQNHECTSVLIERCKITDIQYDDNTGCIYLLASDHGTIVRNCELSLEGTAMQGGGIMIFGGGNDSLIENNNIHHCDIGVYNKHGVNAATNGPVIRNNYFHDMNRAGNGWAVSMQTDKARIHNNLLVRTKGIGIFSIIGGGCNSQGAWHSNITHNTIVEGGYILLGDPKECDLGRAGDGYTYRPGLQGGARFTSVLDNLVYQTATGPVFILWEYGTGPDYLGGHDTTSDYNLFYAPASVCFNEYHTGYTFDAFKAATSLDAHSVFAAPTFAGGPTPTSIAGYALAAGSPGKSAASDGLDIGANTALVGPQGLAVDTTPPSVPTGLTGAAISAAAINLTWSASSDPSTDSVPASGVAVYHIHRNGTQIGTATTTAYTDTGLSAATSYTYAITAVDAAGNASGPSISIAVTTAPSPSAILWRDDFDDGQPLTSKYEDVSTNGLSVSSLDSRTGTNALTQSYSTGQIGAGWVVKYRPSGFPDRIFMRWYHKFEAGFQGFPPKMARIRYRDHATWTSPMSVHCWVETDGTVALDVAAEDSTQANSSGWLPIARSGFSFATPANVGRWVCFEMEVQLNTPGSADGAYRLWIDDTLAVERTGVDLRGSQTYSINECMLDCYWNSGSPRAQSRFYDSFVIATAKIGPEPEFASYTTWRSANFSGTDLANDAVSGPDADPDSCGLTNLARYAFDLPARGRVANPVALTITGTGSNQRLTLTFPRMGYATGLSYVVQSSTDLVTWTDLQTVPPGYPKTFTFTDTVAITSAARRFLRLRIVAP